MISSKSFKKQPICAFALAMILSTADAWAQSRVVKILTRRGSNSSRARQGVAGVAPSIPVLAAAFPAKETEGRCFALVIAFRMVMLQELH